MTQEEKAKRYDEALEELRGLLEGIREEKCKILEEDITSIFPELQENEDERIRKGIIRNLQYLMDMSEGFVKEDLQERIAWLEKQGEQKPQGKTALEAINEEKVNNANKVEPKFKAGDWIVRELDNSVHQVKAVIENISNGKYGYDLTKGGYISSQDANFYHLWTIQDAKEGDVLFHSDSASNGIFIFKKIIDRGFAKEIICYCDYDSEDHFCLGEHHTCCYTNAKILHPATKEQRELLFHKMKESGYDWDVDKKELKKIKDEIEIPYGAKDSELMEASYNIPKGFHAEIDGDKVVIKKGKKPTEWSEKYIADVFEKVGLAKIVREQSNDALTIALQDAMIELSKVTLQPKPTAWSEEDKKTLERVIRCIENHDYMNVDDIHWLKSIKDRYTWRASWEQLDALQYVCRNFNPPLTDKLGWDSLKTLELLYQDLKKL